jgi:uncharacterized PurR-regulated membrane protein YhhQ (DUF165 family)
MINLSAFVQFLNTLPAEALLLCLYSTSVAALALLYRWYGRSGVYLFITLAVIIANMQALKAMQLALFSEPIAMGTTLFMTTFLATDLLAEREGAHAARQAIWLSFAGVLFTTVIMVLTLGVNPANDMAAEQPDALSAESTDGPGHFYRAHQAIATLFLPAPAIFIASLTAYLISQFIDVRLFLMIKKVTHSKHLWLRSCLSTTLSALIDNVIFSLLAWKILSPLQIDTKTLIFTYILGTYAMRLILTALNIPFLYGLQRIKVQNHD